MSRLPGRLRRLITSHGALRSGHGLVSGSVALGLGIGCMLGVLAFHFPEYLTTPQLRKSYDVALLRDLLYWSLVIAGALALFNIALGRARWLSSAAFATVALAALGFAKEVIDAYIVIVGFHAVLNHANVSLPLGPLKKWIVTPDFHHWHHAQDPEAIDRNYAAHFAFIDHLFGTAMKSDRTWPAAYGVQGDYVPEGFWKQTVFPFVWKDARRRG